mmetsp:Transcript_14776/g.22557  ORF Transcript_14776/g.22557 Transcript_14776/m.22557 type:complete len:91 (-) Transcript_14776:652-924(-)
MGTVLVATLTRRVVQWRNMFPQWKIALPSLLLIVGPNFIPMKLGPITGPQVPPNVRWQVWQKTTSVPENNKWKGSSKNLTEIFFFHYETS